MKNDFVALEELGLTASQLRQGTKAASPAAGGAAYMLGASPLVSVLVGIVTYLASNPLSQGYAEIKVNELRVKWTRILANRSQEELFQLGYTMSVRYPFIYQKVMGKGMLPE